MIARSMMAVTAIGEGLDDLKEDLKRTTSRTQELEDEGRERTQELEDETRQRGYVAEDRAAEIAERLRREGREKEAEEVEAAHKRYQDALARADRIQDREDRQAHDREMQEGARGPGRRRRGLARHPDRRGRVFGRRLAVARHARRRLPGIPRPGRRFQHRRRDRLRGRRRRGHRNRGARAGGTRGETISDTKKYNITASPMGNGGVLRDKRSGVRYQLDRGQLRALQGGKAKIASLDDGLYLQVRDRKIKLRPPA